MCQMFERRWDSSNTYALELAFVFEAICATYVDAEVAPYLAIWCHHDGRNLGMTGMSSHQVYGVPSGYYLHHSLSEDVDIYYRDDYEEPNT